MSNHIQGIWSPPTTNKKGWVLTSTGQGSGVKWTDPASSFSVTLPYTFSVSGTLSVPSGATNFLPPFFFPVPHGQAVKLMAVIGKVRSGSCTLSVQHNNVNTPGLVNLNITSSSSSHTPTNNIVVSNNDTFAPVISAVSSADGLSLTFYFQVT